MINLCRARLRSTSNEREGVGTHHRLFGIGRQIEGDAQEAIMAAPWLEPIPPELGARTFDVRAKGPIGATSKNSLNKAGG